MNNFRDDEEEMEAIEEQYNHIQRHIQNIDMNLDALKGNSDITVSDGKTTQVLSGFELADLIAHDAEAIKDAIMWR